MRAVRLAALAGLLISGSPAFSQSGVYANGTACQPDSTTLARVYAERFPVELGSDGTVTSLGFIYPDESAGRLEYSIEITYPDGRQDYLPGFAYFAPCEYKAGFNYWSPILAAFFTALVTLRAAFVVARLFQRETY